MSYAPPWQGQPNPFGAVFRSSTRPLSVSISFGSSVSPCGCTGQPRWTQRFEISVKLGWPSFVSPLLRTNAVRRDTSSGSSFTDLNFVITHWSGGKLSSGPRSTGSYSWPVKDGSTMKPSAGSVTTTPIAAPIPSVAPSRNTLRG